MLQKDYINCNIIPAVILDISKTAKTRSVFFIDLFCLKRTRIPSPAFDDNPAIADANEIVPLINITVIITDIAQFGINPKNAAIIGWNIVF